MWKLFLIFCQLLQPQDSLRLEKYCQTISLVWPPEGAAAAEVCRSRILPLFVYPGTFIKSICNYGLHILRGRVLSLRLPGISIFIPPPHFSVAAANGLYDTAGSLPGWFVRCHGTSEKDAFFSSDSL